MATWYNAKVSFQKEDESGSLKTITENYLVDAVSYTEAEARMADILTMADYLITLTRMKIEKVFGFQNTTDSYYRAKVLYIVWDEKSQKEKKTPYFFLVRETTIKRAYDLLISELGEVNDYEISDIGITPILEVFHYNE